MSQEAHSPALPPGLPSTPHPPSPALNLYPSHQSSVPYPSPLPNAPRILVVVNHLQETKDSDTNLSDREILKSYGCVYTAMRRAVECGIATKVVWIGGEKSNDSPPPGNYTRLFKGTGNDLHIGIPIGKEEIRLYYTGFCRSFLWRVMHYETESQFSRKEWEAYKAINQRFADAIISFYEPGDLLLVQDYNFMLLPLIVRNAIPTAHISFFLHSPFPTSELFRVLAVREKLLRGMLGADLIGFQTWDYSRHFLSACTRVLQPEEVETTHKGVMTLMADMSKRYVSVVVCPTGIDPSTYAQSCASAEVLTTVHFMQEKYKGMKIIFSRDRLESSNGVVQRLLAFEKFLEAYPQWLKKVVFLQVCNRIEGTGEEVESWKPLNQTVHELIGRINGKYGLPDYCPLIYSTNPLTSVELCALYRITDVLAVTPLRDGLNLAPYEYIVCQSYRGDGPGVVILSEFAGASQSLSGCLRVSPWDIEQLSTSFEQALSMDVEQRRERHRYDLRYVHTATALTWANTNVSELQVSHMRRRMSRVSLEIADSRTPGLRINIPPRVAVDKVVARYWRAKKRLLVLDYDGTLVPIARSPSEAMPSKKVLDLLKALESVRSCPPSPTPQANKPNLQDPKNTVFVVSGRDQTVLEEWLGALPIGLAAEHGCFYRPTPQYAAMLARLQAGNESQQFLKTPEGQAPSRPRTSTAEAPRTKGAIPWESLVKNLDDSWRKVVTGIFEDYKDRTPGSLIENKLINITWHYRNADPNYADWVAMELSSYLTLGVAPKMPIEVLSSKKAIEVRPKGINKGSIVKMLLAHQHLIQTAQAPRRPPNATLSTTVPLASKEASEAEPFDFVLCIGDDRTDEDMFVALQEAGSRIYPEHHFAIVVEDKSSEARYSVRHQTDVAALLESFTASSGFP